MSGEGKYTTYASPSSDKNNLLNKLYHSSNSTVQPPTQDLVGKEKDAQAVIIKIAQAVLQPKHQVGDLNMFPAGVNLDYSDAPNTSQIAWAIAGDPANPYMPDISSPGPGKTDGTDKSVDPQVGLADMAKTIPHLNGYVPGGPNTGTKSPTATNAKLYAAQLLGVPSKLGDSGANT